MATRAKKPTNHPKKDVPQKDRQRYHGLVTLVESGDAEGAISRLQALARGPGDPREKAAIWLVVASLQRRLGKAPGAREALAEARTLSGGGTATDARAAFIDASLDFDQGSWDVGLEKLDALLRDFPAVLEQSDNRDLLEDVKRWRGIALYRLGRPADARPLLEQAASGDYQKATSLYHLGRSCYDLGDLQKAQQSLLEALRLELDPVHCPGAHYVLGLSYHWRGQSARAVEELKWCLDNDAEERVPRRYVLSAIVDACKALGQDAEAAKYSAMLRST